MATKYPVDLLRLNELFQNLPFTKPGKCTRVRATACAASSRNNPSKYCDGWLNLGPEPAALPGPCLNTERAGKTHQGQSVTILNTPKV